ncbi:cyclic nucleotide-binding domain-containing protein [Frateuria defendens]|uniref:cyclic nucleotide-binding domain-containing protein n=1 Tax=Frateuria defendens TaxID=2219559 RepID=UPI00066FFD33|nr:cyclic nucleotide-binding domain-containing protein [Frateuria defendens]
MSATVLDLNQLRRSCSACALHELCLPTGIDRADLERLDAAIRDKRSVERGKALFRQGDPFRSLYVVRSGTLKTYVEDEAGSVQVLGFALPGEIVGVDALAGDVHQCSAEALERSSLCELPFAQLESVVRDVPALQHQLMRVISREVVAEQSHLVMMGKQQAQERLASFLHSLAGRYARLSRDPSVLTLPMSRYEIANYLGLVVETVSRLFGRMEDAGILAVNRKVVRVLRPDLLAELCGSQRSSSHGGEAH